MNLRNLMKVSAMAAACFALAAAPKPAAADVGSFYRGKVMTMYIGVSAGGGYDAYARMVTRHITRFIPGNPRMIAKNYTGAGGMRMLNSLFNVFKQDGTNLAHILRNLVSEPLFGNKAARFDGSKIKWLGSANQEYSMCTFWHKHNINTVDDMLSRPLIMGGISIGSTIDIHTRLVNNLLGGQMRLVTGYPGGADINLAMQRGEVEGRCGWSWSSINATGAAWLRDKKITMTLQFGMKQHPDLKHVPLIRDLVKNKKDAQALDVHLSAQLYGRPFGMGPGVPDDRFKAMRKAFWATMNDKKFLSDSKKRRLQIDPAPGEEVERLVKMVYAFPPDVIARAKEIGSSSARTRVSKAVVPVNTYTGKITKVKRKGRRVAWKGGGKKGKLKVSGRRTKITVGGKKAKRKSLKVGMNCTFKVRGASQALNIDCK
ncbi:MAG: hypothetical protein O6831_09065 [Alphaproteobacteria bacterium]|nr:hypothetical protein [Alphaproteobacteria bacterium]MCZ6496067.1 hypothetical protein [Alphaproteobacteria bacterium]MCZ6813419.1 hypothetical protein [Alphaproteobacteria bacterium]